MALEVGEVPLLTSDSLTGRQAGSYAAAEIPATIYHWTGPCRRSSPALLEWEGSRTLAVDVLSNNGYDCAAPVPRLELEILRVVQEPWRQPRLMVAVDHEAKSKSETAKPAVRQLPRASR
ncbi:hypothetical protein BO71DRAFT_429411 [Aspergillus ellipticus CBS 707.79]|uniref:Uncharacterized protein n=1 Tax=Aspergillus ellipticus CBS 707.79 TaxID=1448320 RepID=A0A319DCU9_9EURO|nr:hypothetical protein BO71DRAFT_429411 [Aspergillus ellipticus CBS 707.79]